MKCFWSSVQREAARQLQIVRDVVIGLAKSGIGIQNVGILAEEIIVPFIVQTGDADWDRCNALAASPSRYQLTCIRIGRSRTPPTGNC